MLYIARDSKSKTHTLSKTHFRLHADYGALKISHRTETQYRDLQSGPTDWTFQTFLSVS